MNILVIFLFTLDRWSVKFFSLTRLFFLLFLSGDRIYEKTDLCFLIHGSESSLIGGNLPVYKKTSILYTGGHRSGGARSLGTAAGSKGGGQTLSGKGHYPDVPA